MLCRAHGCLARPPLSHVPTELVTAQNPSLLGFETVPLADVVLPFHV